MKQIPSVSVSYATNGSSTTLNELLTRFHTQRGTAEQHIKEGKYAINWPRLSCKRFRDNEVKLQHHALAYNPGSFLLRADLPEDIADWSLTSLQSRLIKIGAGVTHDARAITFQLAEIAVPCGIIMYVRIADMRDLAVTS